MSLSMYEHLVKYKDSIKINEEEGTITTARGTHGNVCSSTGYLRAKVGGKNIQVHQLLAVVYYGEECVGKQVNHKNGNKLNNKKYNLELTTQAENVKHQWGIGLSKVALRPVLQLDLQGNLIQEHVSMESAARHVGGLAGSLSRAVRGYRMRNGKKEIVKTYKGFVWKAKD